MAGKCEHGLTTKECFVCASPKYGAQRNQTEIEMLRKKLLDVALLLKVCAWALRRGTSPELGERALNLLKKHDLLGSPLRSDPETNK